MKKECNRTFIKRGKRHKLTWIIPNSFLFKLPRRRSSPKFETTYDVAWKISLRTKRHSGEDYLFCTLLRKPDGGPSAVHFCVDCKLSIGPNEHAQSPQEKTFRQGSSMDFRLLPESYVRQSINNCLANGPVKLILQVGLQRMSVNHLHAKGFSLTTDLELFTFSRHSILENFLYPKQGSRIDEIVDSTTQIHGKLFAEVARSFCTTKKALPPSSQMMLSSSHCSRIHLLDVHGYIHASSERWKCDHRTYEQRVSYIFQKTTKEGIRKETEIFSRDGEISVRLERSRASTLYRISQEWIFTPFSRGNNGNLRKDMSNNFWNGRKGAYLEIRANGGALKVHRDLIAVRLPVFSVMLSYDMIERQSNVINIEDFNLEVLIHFLNFVYSGTFEYGLAWEDICKLYKIADKYFVRSLCRVCSRQLVSRISLENYEELLALSDVLRDRDLQTALRYFSHLHINNSICSDKREHPILRLRQKAFAYLKKLRHKV
ncbi:hypothetical protein AVEN_258648-1 [Araneus ventricosus]|uniref:BTB domain-containing protein n=1 Tax=Araneus ventricosus TaxID=182803 RepID=A0A4Y2JJD9_ARAVE|nr:hypothetical protein AVEN_258648-1 [Araneus ventricosus]